MLTVRPLYCPAAGVPSTAQASRMRGRRHAAANHFQHASASTAQSLLPAKGRRGARTAAVLYWNNPFGPVRWRHAERRFLSCGCLLVKARSWPGPCGRCRRQPGGPPVWRPGAAQAAGPGTAALELDGVTPVLVSGGGARSAAAQSLPPLRPAAGAARCHRMVAIVDILVTGAALAGSPQGEDGAVISHRVAGGRACAADAVQVAMGRAGLRGHGGPVGDPGDRSAASGQVAGQRGGAGDGVEHAA